MRILVIGTTGCGKTTTAGRIARQLNVPHVELDALFWLPEWKERTDDDFREEVIRALAVDAWVADGNYHRQIGDLTWRQADYIVWVDTNFWIALPRLFRRSMWRLWSREPLWGINRESWRKLFFDRHSILIWFFQSFGRHRQQFGLRATDPHNAGQLVRLRSDREIEAWLQVLPVGSRHGAEITERSEPAV